MKIFLQRVQFESRLADGAVNDAGLVDAVGHLPGLGVLHRGRDIRRHRADLRIRHQAARPQDLAELADHAHGVGAGDHAIEVDLAGLHLGRQILQPDDVRAGGLRQLLVLAGSEHRPPHRLARAMRHHGRAAHLLVGLAGVDAEIHGRIHRFGELGGGEFLHQLQRLLHRILLARSELGLPGLDTFRDGHAQTPSTSTPMLRALPAIVRTAASRSAAVRSGCFILAISSAWARVSFPTLSVCGFGLPLSSFNALRISTDAGGDFRMNVKLLSAYAVMTTGSISPGSIFCVWALNALQNSMMFRPRWPSAGPMGGEGFAFPAGTWSLIKPTTFFATRLLL